MPSWEPKLKTDPQPAASTVRIPLAVGLVYFAICLLTFGGTFHSSADEWLMFAVTESLGRWGLSNVDQLYWVNEYMGWARFGLDGHLYVPYTSFSAGQSLIGLPAFLLGLTLPGAGIAQATLLTNGLVVSITLGALVLTARELGLSLAVALSTAALFGLGSALLPYSRTYFGEPLLGLAYLTCFYCALRCRSTERRGQRGGRERWIWMSGASAATAIVAKPLGLLVVPAVLGFLLASCSGQSLARVAKIVVSFCALPACVGLLLLALQVSRFGWATALQSTRGFNTPLGEGLWGLLLSPGRSLFVFSPVALLSLPGFYFLYRRDRLLTVALSFTVAAYLIATALWDGWHAGFTSWGPRYLTSLLPLLALGAAALLAVPSYHRVISAMGLSIGGVGAAVQVLAVANNPLPAMEDLAKHYPGLNEEVSSAAVGAFADLGRAPVLQQWKRFSVQLSDLAWLEPKGKIDWLALGLSVALLAAASVYLFTVCRWPSSGLAKYGLVPLAAVTLGVVSLLLPRFAASDRFIEPGYRAALAQFDRLSSPSAALVTLDLAENYYFNYQRGLNRRYGLSANDYEPLPPHVVRQVDRITAQHPELWLLAPSREVSATERRLRAKLPLASEWPYGDLRLVRIRPASAAPAPTAKSLQIPLAEQLELTAVEVLDEVSPGQMLYVDLNWRALRPSPVDYTFSLQMIGPNGQLVSQDDRPAAQGRAPTTKWILGEPVFDPRVLSIPRQPQAGSYRLLAIAYDSATGRRLRAPGGEDAVVLASLAIR